MSTPAPTQPQSVLDAKTIDAAASVEVWNGKGEKVRFGSIFAEQKTIVVFIRHFFCGNCMQYVSQLTTVRKEALEEAGVKIALVGCGEWKLIENYKNDTGFEGEIFANPDRKLYHALGMTVENLDGTPSGTEKRSYLKQGIFKVTMSSIWRGPLKNPLHIGKQGSLTQLGGDFVFGPGVICSYSSRMQHTEDHVEVAQLMKEAGVAFP
ncbi:hypothetical protein FA95DRAFT_1514890 [Auriscalpium vulgare]|uniref:Uncharacterized protein n=1 Tax=Auriscalpium vulgare TaxID=40419 RepID=A0ACB8S1G6_9AGAM|nr:hypothetical protein FA95DRAFT_1514890 [Auriscalpium vulgare]